MKVSPLSEDERNTLTSGLRVAAERFRDNAKVVRQEVKGVAYDRLAEQFDRQAEDSIRLAEAIEAADEITIQPGA